MVTPRLTVTGPGRFTLTPLLPVHPGFASFYQYARLQLLIVVLLSALAVCVTVSACSAVFLFSLTDVQCVSRFIHRRGASVGRLFGQMEPLCACQSDWYTD